MAPQPKVNKAVCTSHGCTGARISICANQICLAFIRVQRLHNVQCDAIEVKQRERRNRILTAAIGVTFLTA